MTAIVTAWEGDEWDGIAAVTVPLMQRYAHAHGHSLITAKLPQFISRPASWKKLVVIAAALQHEEAVLWLDCDVIVCRGNVDIFESIPPDSLQAMVRHKSPEGEIPNCGVWYVTRKILPTLVAMAMMDGFVSHKWWEQGAMMSLLGYVESGGVSSLGHATDIYDATHWLDEEWNVWPGSPPGTSIRFFHACGVIENRLGYIREVVNALQQHSSP